VQNVDGWTDPISGIWDSESDTSSWRENLGLVYVPYGPNFCSCFNFTYGTLKTRKLSYRKDNREMHLMYGCPGGAVGKRVCKFL